MHKNSFSQEFAVLLLNFFLTEFNFLLFFIHGFSREEVTALGAQVVLDYDDHRALASSPHMFTCNENDNTETFYSQRFVC